MSATTHLGLELSTYGETSGIDWTANHEANWASLDALISNILCHEGDILTYENELLIAVL